MDPIYYKYVIGLAAIIGDGRETEIIAGHCSLRTNAKRIVERTNGRSR